MIQLANVRFSSQQVSTPYAASHSSPQPQVAALTPEELRLTLLEAAQAQAGAGSPEEAKGAATEAEAGAGAGGGGKGGNMLPNAGPSPAAGRSASPYLLVYRRLPVAAAPVEEGVGPREGEGEKCFVGPPAHEAERVRCQNLHRQRLVSPTLSRFLLFLFHLLSAPLTAPFPVAQYVIFMLF